MDDCCGGTGGGSGGVDGLTSAAKENEEASSEGQRDLGYCCITKIHHVLQWIMRELMDCRVLQNTIGESW